MNEPEHQCALCGKPGATFFSRVAVYSGNPDGEWRCAEGNSHGVSSREAWSCYYRYQQREKRERVRECAER